MIDNLRKVSCDEGAGAIIEYALVTALVSLTTYATLSAFGVVLQTFFAQSSSGLANVAKLAR